MSSKPWETLRFVSKVEILPSSGSIGVFVSLEEDNEYVEFSMGQVRMIGQDRLATESGVILWVTSFQPVYGPLRGL